MNHKQDKCTQYFNQCKLYMSNTKLETQLGEKGEINLNCGHMSQVDNK